MLIPFTQGWLSSGKNLKRFGSTKRIRQVLAVAPKVAAIANLFDLELLRKLIGLSKDNRHKCENIIMWIIISINFQNTAKDGIVQNLMNLNSLWLTQHLRQLGSDGQQLPLICCWIGWCVIIIAANCIHKRNRDQTKKSEINLKTSILPFEQRGPGAHFIAMEMSQWTYHGTTVQRFSSIQKKVFRDILFFLDFTSFCVNVVPSELT